MGAALTRLLAWNYGEHFEWQRVAAGSNLFSAVPCGQERLQLDGQHDRQPGGSQVSRLWSAVHVYVSPQQLPAERVTAPDLYRGHRFPGLYQRNDTGGESISRQWSGTTHLVNPSA